MPLTTSNNLGLVQLVAGQNNPEQTANDKGGELDSFLTQTLSKSVSAGSVTLTSTEFTRYASFLVTGATVGGRSVTLQAVARTFLIESDSGNSQSISIIMGSTTLALAATKIALYRTDGTANGLKLLLTSDVAAGGGGLIAANNLSDVSNATTSRTNLGLAIGTNVQAFDAQLSSLVRQNSQSAAYTTVLTDGGKHIFHPSADTTARTWTIDSNANVAYPIGTAITFVNQHSAGIVTIAITADTMRLAGSGTTGSRTLAADGIATALKIGTTEWIISGTGLT